MMSLSEAPLQIMFEDLPKPEDVQFFMRQLSVYNWGTFSQIHTLRFSDEGALLIGPSGAGKSTLLDAISALIVPPKKVHFNAAAEEGDRRAHDRTIASYVRGAWADKGASESRDIVKQYLRPGAAVSAICLQYGNREGKTVSLVRVFWITGASASANVNMHYLVTNGAFELSALQSFDGDLRKLRRHLDTMEGVRQHESFGAYQEHWCRVMGIDDASALDLLHKTQSTKSLGDLNRFLREFMLEEPKTFEKADSLVAEFGELDQAHRAVVAAREQIQALLPAKEAFEEHSRLGQAMAESKTLSAATDNFVQHLKVELLTEEMARLAILIDQAQADVVENTSHQTRAQAQVDNLQRQHLDAGGADIQSLKAQLTELNRTRAGRVQERQRYEALCTTLGWMAANGTAEFAQVRAQARQLIEQSLVQGEDWQAKRDALAVEKDRLEKEFGGLRVEMTSLEGTSSNIPASLQQLREQMCRALNLPMNQVAFVGELLQVKNEFAAKWAPAAERLLGGFGRDLIVDARHHRRVAQWVDATHLGRKLVYHPVTSAALTGSLREPRTANSMIHKLEQKPHAFSKWILRELTERFDYECVNLAADLAGGDNRITAAGQIRHSRGRSEKDDRKAIGDRRDWVLGFDSRDKLEHLRGLSHKVAKDLVDVQQQARCLDEARKQEHVRMGAAERLLDYEWEKIDVASITARISDLEVNLHNLTIGNTILTNLDALIIVAKRKLQEVQDSGADLRSRIRKHLEDIDGYQVALEDAKVGSVVLEPAHRRALIARLPAEVTLELRNVDKLVAQVREALQQEMMDGVKEQARMASTVLAAFNHFIQRWPEESGALQGNLESAPDFFAKLKRLEDDGLPEHEERFRNLLSQQSTQRLAELGRHVTEGRREIALRLDDVNDALRTVPYNQDSYLRINPVDLHLPEVADFRERLRAIFSDQARALDEDLAQAEQRFALLRQLVLDLKADDPDKRRWRERVLDVRQHVEFNAEELERGTDRQIEIYGGSSGKSGGQRQKLTATCLASALRYKLGGSDGGAPQYAAVVLDEAFTKTDNDFTKTCMQVFKELGFQMIVATPIKSVMTLEEFVGGAVFVSISNRHTSALFAIQYDQEDRRLVLSEGQRAQAQVEANADS